MAHYVTCINCALDKSTCERRANMQALDEPARAVCATCYHVEGHDEYRCYKQADWAPNGCIHPVVMGDAA